MSIIGIQRRLAPAGRIRIGEQVPTSGGKTRPSKLTTFRFTSSNKRAIEGVASLYGGDAHPWTDAPTEGQWEVVTDASEIPVVVPPERMSFSQFYEEWSGGGCKRRCDGQYDQISEGDCVCDPENRACKPHTRISVMLASLPGIGLWRLDTKGHYASEELGGSFDIAEMLTKSLGRNVLPGILRLEQRVVKSDGKTNKFAVPVLDFDVDMGALALGYTATPNGELVNSQTGELAPARPSLTPVPPDQTSVPSMGEQMAAVDAPRAASTRSNAAAPIPRTGLAPKGQGTGIAPASAPDDSSSEDDKPKTAEQRRNANMMRLFALKGITDRDERLAYCVRVIARSLSTSKDLTVAEANQIIAQLKVDVGEEPPDNGEMAQSA